MFEEYRRALRQPATPVRTFRLRAVLFPAVEQTLTEEELADGTKFFTTCAAAASWSCPCHDATVCLTRVRLHAQTATHTQPTSTHLLGVPR